jgi:hypothetical protein
MVESKQTTIEKILNWYTSAVLSLQLKANSNAQYK